MSKTKKPRCSKEVWRQYAHSPCLRTGTVQRDGKWYCRQHDPVAKQEQRAAYDAMCAETNRIAERTAVCIRACKPFKDPERDIAELLAVLRAIIAWAPENPLPMGIRRRARSALERVLTND